MSYDDAKKRWNERTSRPRRDNLNQSNIYKRYVNAACEDENELDKTNLAALDSTIDEFNAIEEKEKVKRLQKFMSDKKRYKESGN